MLERLKKSLFEAPVFKWGEFNYFMHPITDGVPEIKPDGRADRGACWAYIADGVWKGLWESSEGAEEDGWSGQGLKVF